MKLFCESVKNFTVVEIYATRFIALLYLLII